MESKKIIMHYPDGSVRIESHLKGTVAIFSNRGGDISFRHFDAAARSSIARMDKLWTIDPMVLWSHDSLASKRGAA